MDSMDESARFPEFPNIPDELIGSSNLIEGTTMCPLCHALVREYFLNYNEKLLMCENTECDYPFGLDDLKFFKVNDDVHTNVEILSIRSKTSPDFCNRSVMSTNTWAEIEKMNKIYDSEYSQFDTRSSMSRDSYIHKKISPSIHKKKEFESQLKKKISDIKELNLTLFRLNGGKSSSISKENWLKNLKNLQAMSGQQLLKKEELDRLKKTEPVLGLGELKIDINTKSDSMSSISIEILNK